MAGTANPYGIIAEFDNPADTMHAAEKVRDAGFRKWDVFTPFPVHGMDKAMGLKNSKVGWFSFLVHDRASGVPTTPEDPAAYLHLRFERLTGVDYNTLVAALPDYCVFSQPVRLVDELSLQPADHTALVAPEVATGWALFGASSEWALHFACAHRDDRSLPMNNLRQFLHYLGNQLLIGVTDIRMP